MVPGEVPKYSVTIGCVSLKIHRAKAARNTMSQREELTFILCKGVVKIDIGYRYCY